MKVRLFPEPKSKYFRPGFSKLMKCSSLLRHAGWLCALLFGLNSLGLVAAPAAAPPPLRALFLGDNGHHKPADRFKQLQPVLAKRGIDFTYTESLDELNSATLAGYDCVIIFANHPRI